MYNAVVKSQYVNYAISKSESQNVKLYESSLVNRFKRSERLEAEMGKDILDMSQEELKLFLSKFLKGGKDYRINTLSMIKLYCEWGVVNNLSSIDLNWLNDLKLSNINIAQTYVDKMVSSEEELISCVNPMLDSINRDTQDNIIRCIYLLLFAGIQYDDIWYLKESDVCIQSKTINYKDKNIFMSEALYEIVAHNLSMEQLLVLGRNNEYFRDIIREGYLISNTREYGYDRNKMKRTYTSAISKMFSKSETKELTIRGIYDSGVFCRIYLNEKKTGEIDCLEYLWARRNNSATIDYPEHVKDKCRYEYDIWKRSFNLS